MKDNEAFISSTLPDSDFDQTRFSSGSEEQREAEEFGWIFERLQAGRPWLPTEIHKSAVGSADLTSAIDTAKQYYNIDILVTDPVKYANKNRLLWHRNVALSPERPILDQSVSQEKLMDYIEHLEEPAIPISILAKKRCRDLGCHKSHVDFIMVHEYRFNS